MILRSIFHHRMNTINLVLLFLFSFSFTLLLHSFITFKQSLLKSDADIRNRVYEIEGPGVEQFLKDQSYLMAVRPVYDTISLTIDNERKEVTVLPLQIEDSLNENEIMMNTKKHLVTVTSPLQTVILTVKATTKEVCYTSESLYKKLNPFYQIQACQIAIDKRSHVEDVLSSLSNAGYRYQLSDSTIVDEKNHLSVMDSFLNRISPFVALFFFFFSLFFLYRFCSTHRHQLYLFYCMGYSNASCIKWYSSQIFLLSFFASSLCLLLFLFAHFWGVISVSWYEWFLPFLFSFLITFFSWPILWLYLRKKEKRF